MTEDKHNWTSDVELKATVTLSSCDVQVELVKMLLDTLAFYAAHDTWHENSPFDSTSGVTLDVVLPPAYLFDKGEKARQAIKKVEQRGHTQALLQTIADEL